ncbi:hypothetical protein [Macrococcus equipercicus]|uniref:Uncharacterized protein n=1 Tax=Macrococcus equipercicus TaxID=69967 RepID=A0A9Q9BSD7_9STAP|nr:hypothetical protein [Macrococcus equipercicus]UTH13329.1 hypothetical protein KFV11_08655 [Macrococcus equipercicus]
MSDLYFGLFLITLLAIPVLLIIGIVRLFKKRTSKKYFWAALGSFLAMIIFGFLLASVTPPAKKEKPVKTVAEQSTTEKPTTEKPTTEKPTTEKPTTEKPTTEKPTTEKPTTEKPTTEKPTTEKPTTEKPTTETPTTEKPTTEKPTTETPTTEKPAQKKVATAGPNHVYGPIKVKNIKDNGVFYVDEKTHKTYLGDKKEIFQAEKEIDENLGVTVATDMSFLSQHAFDFMEDDATQIQKISDKEFVYESKKLGKKYDVIYSAPDGKTVTRIIVSQHQD